MTDNAHGNEKPLLYDRERCKKRKRKEEAQQQTQRQDGNVLFNHPRNWGKNKERKKEKE